jgi:Tfp pilus assembly protein PilV
MGFELGRLVREAAGDLGARVAEAARELRRLAHAQADRVWRDVGELLRQQLAGALGEKGRIEPTTRSESNATTGPRTRAVVETMAEVLALSGYRSVRAEARDLIAPDVVQGTMRSHRPSLTAIGGGRPVLVDVYLPEESEPDEQLSRWQLFASAAAQCRGEFHVVVPAWIEGSGGKKWVRQAVEGAGVTITKVWEI